MGRRGRGGGGNIPQSCMCLTKFCTHGNYQVLLYSNERVQNVIENEGGVYHVVHSCITYRFDVSSHIYEAAKLRIDGVK